MRVYAAVPADRTSPDDLDAIAKRYPDDPILKTGVASLALDGSIESQTAAMLAPYTPKGSDEGALAIAPEEFSRLVAALDAHGWQVAVHAAGDRAVRVALDAFGADRQDVAGRQHAAATASRTSRVVDTEDMPRFGALGIIASMQPLRARPDAPAAWSANVGPEREALGWPMRSLSAAGAHLAFGTGWPPLPRDPLAGIKAAVSRVGCPGARAADAEVGDQRLDVRRGLGLVRRAPQGHDQAGHARGSRHPLDRHLRRPRQARGRRSRHDDFRRQDRLPPIFLRAFPPPVTELHGRRGWHLVGTIARPDSGLSPLPGCKFERTPSFV